MPDSTRHASASGAGLRRGTTVRLLRALAGALGLLVCVWQCGAQVLPFRNYTIRDGLLSNVCYFFFQDSAGFLWVSTDMGLSRFDGRQFSNFERTGDSLRIGVIISYAQTADGRIWAGGNGNGLFEYDGRRFIHHEVGKGTAGNTVTALFEAEPGVLLIGTEDGLFVYRKGSIAPLVGDARLMRSFKFDVAGSIFKGPDGRIRVVFDGEVRCLDPATGHLSDPLPHPPGCDYFSWVYQLSDGRYVVSNRDNSVLYIFRNHTIEQTLVMPDCVSAYALEDNEGWLWIGTNKGIIKTRADHPDLTHARWITTKNGLPSNLISSLVLDREFNLWFGSYGKGIYKLEETETYRFTYPFAAGLGCEDPKGRLWFSTPDGLRVIGKTPSGDWNEQHLEPFPDKYFKSMGAVKVLPDGQLWLGCNDGHLVNFRIEEGRRGDLRLRFLREIGPNTGLPPSKPIWMFFDSHGRLWYAHGNKPLLYAFDVSEKKPRLLKTIDFGVPGKRVSNRRDMVEDREGNLWFAYEETRVLRIGPDLEVREVLENLPGNDDSDVNCLLFDRDGGLWFGTQLHGLIYRSPDGKTRRYTMADGLFSEGITQMAEGPGRTIWLASWHGLGFVHYGDGPPRFDENRELTESPIWSLGVFPDGTGWVATNFEVVFYKKRASRQPFSPPAFLRKVTANGQERPTSGLLQLSANEKDLVFEFGAVCLQSHAGIRFSYRLLSDGKGTWSTPSTIEQVNFAGLKPGAYRFQVKAMTANGLESPAPAEIDFVIVPPVWARWWFLAGCAVLVSGAGWMLVRMRIRRLLEIERLRARIAADLHDDIGSGLTRIALASEMLLLQQKEKEAPAQTALTRRMGSTARELVEAMSDIVWSIDPQNDSLQRVADRIRFFANDLAEARGIHCRFAFEPGSQGGDRKLGSGIVSALLLIAKEAVNNVVRHAGCHSLDVRIQGETGGISLIVADDGSGFDETSLVRINGLTNMRRRAEKAGGRLEIRSAPGAGTRITAFFPH